VTAVELRVAVARVRPRPDALPLPRYMTAGAAGMDLLADVEQDVVLAVGERRLVPTGIAIALPAGWEGQVRPRSGLAIKHGVTCLNSPGTIDADYRGPVGIVLINLGSEPFVIRRGERIAQLIVAPIERAQFTRVGELPSSQRDSGGFGSTGTTGAT